MADVNVLASPFNKQETWSAQGATLTYYVGRAHTGSVPNPTSGFVPLLATQISISQQRSMAELFPINTDGVGTNAGSTKVTIFGASKGSVTIGTIFSPYKSEFRNFIEAVSKTPKSAEDMVAFFLRPFGNFGATNATAASAEASNPANIVIELGGVDLVSWGFDIQGGETAMSSMPMNFTFTNAWIHMP